MTLKYRTTERLSLLEGLLARTLGEMQRQNKKWGRQTHPSSGWVTILAEEFGEVARAAQEDWTQELVDELIQTAAVAIQFAAAVVEGPINE